MKKTICCLLSIFVLCLTQTSQAEISQIEGSRFCYPFYAGFSFGYGSTTWGALVPLAKRQSSAMAMSTPKYVREGGFVQGAFVGLELLPTIALEVSYEHYPDAHVTFDPDSIFTFEHLNLHELISSTETLAFIVRCMMVIPETFFRFYVSAGAAVLHRWDQINNRYRGSPTFGLGFNYTFSERWMAELGGNYTAGYGESELDPANDYMPFLYSAFVRIAYRF